MGYKISEIEYHLPDTVISNELLNAKYGIDVNFDKIGIRERRIAGEDQSTSDLACLSANKLFENHPVKKEEIDLLILCTQNPDYKLPTTACIVQHKLGLKTSCMAFDVNLGCSGFVYCVTIAGSMINSGLATKALVLTVDQYSKIINYTDKNTASLFGDASASAIVEKCEDGYGVIGTDFGTDGSGAENLIAFNSGVCKNPGKDNFLYMNGREIFKFSFQTVPVSVNNVLSKCQVTKEDIRYFIFHQANKFMLNEIKKKMSLSEEQFIVDMENCGNTVSSTIPIVLQNLRKAKRINRGDLLLLCGFGVGLSWGSVIYKEL